jgi:hypothetical protein
LLFIIRCHDGNGLQPLYADKPYKWAKREIEASDPAKDYEKIWRLSIEYTGGRDFIQNIMYPLASSNFMLPGGVLKLSGVMMEAKRHNTITLYGGTIDHIIQGPEITQLG